MVFWHRVLEKNTFRAGEAFSVEVYKKEKIGVTRKSPFGQTDSVKYTPLKFSSDNFQFLDQIIVNDILSTKFSIKGVIIRNVTDTVAPG